jgi:hypothetical protein
MGKILGTMVESTRGEKGRVEGLVPENAKSDTVEGVARTNGDGEQQNM